MWILGVNYIVKIRVEACIIVPYDQLVLAPIFSQMIQRFAKIADLVKNCRHIKQVSQEQPLCLVLLPVRAKMTIII